MTDSTIYDLTKTVDRLKETVKEFVEHSRSLNNQVQFLVDYMDERGLLEEHSFTFPDGETVYATLTLENGGE